jgi:polysaccharide deacetylase family protein (PEP-CTERM system associated)
VSATAQPAAAARSLTNILSFDVEDWPQSTLDYSLPITERVRDNTLRVLDLLGAWRARGTFFVLGLVAEGFPDLVRRIRDDGHEVATHGHAHRPVDKMSPEEFRQDVRRSRDLIQQVLGETVIGYRAPDFSISGGALWAFEILSEEGLRYDSSIFPFAGPRYGVRAAFPRPFRVLTTHAPPLVEFPLTTITRLGRRLPAAGGGYFRLFPYVLTRRVIRSLNENGIEATSYFHPYEIDPDEIRKCPYPIPWSLRLSQGLLRSRVEAKLRRLLRDFRWAPARDFLARTAAITGGRVLDLTGPPKDGPRWREEA